MARHFNAVAYKTKRQKVYRGMGLSWGDVKDFISNPKDTVVSAVKKYEGEISDYFKDNLDPEVYALASSEISKLGDMTEGELQQKLVELSKKYALTDQNVDRAAKTGITASFNAAGNAFANQYQQIIDQARNGTLFSNIVAGKAPWATYLLAGMAAYVPLAMVFKEQKWVARVPVAGLAAFSAYRASQPDIQQA